MALKQFENLDKKKIVENIKKRIEEFSKNLPDADLQTFKSIPEKFKNMWMLVYQQKLPIYKPILKAKCLDCCCWQAEEITNCNSKMCPIWPYRPYQNLKSEDKETEEEDN